jgi:hypothetical protein
MVASAIAKCPKRTLQTSERNERWLLDYSVCVMISV